MKIKPQFVAGFTVFLAAGVLTAAPASAQDECYGTFACTTTIPLGNMTPETWMGPDDVLGPDEEYVPGYEQPGTPILMFRDETLDDGWEVVPGPLASTMAKKGFKVVLDPMKMKRQMAKKRKKDKKVCKGIETVTYALDKSRRGDYSTRTGQCGTYWDGLWPTTEPCGGESAEPGLYCQTVTQ